MTTDFDKSDSVAKELTSADIALSEYFDFFTKKYSKQINKLDNVILHAAKQGKISVKICVAQYQYGTELEGNRGKFHGFLERYVEQFGYTFTWNKKLNDFSIYFNTRPRTIAGKERQHPTYGQEKKTSNPIWSWYGEDGRRANYQEYWDGEDDLIEEHWTWLEPTADVNLFLTDDKAKIVRFWYGKVSWEP